MLSSGPTLPDGRLITRFSAFFKGGKVLTNGHGDATFNIPPEMLEALIDLRETNGLAINITIHATKLDPEFGILAGLLGIGEEGGEGDGGQEQEPEPEPPSSPSPSRPLTPKS